MARMKLFTAFEDLREDLDGNEDEVEIMGVGLDNVAPNAFSELREIAQVTDGVDNLEDIREDILSQDNISEEDFKRYLVATEQFTKTLNLNLPFYKNVTLESITDYRAALESYGEKNNAILNVANESLGDVFNTIKNSFTYLLNIFSNYEKDVRKLKEEIKTLPDTKKDITLKVHRWLAYDDSKVCSSIEEYKKELKLSVESLETLLKNFDDVISHHGFFGDIRSLLSYLKSDEGRVKFLKEYYEVYKSFYKLVESVPGSTVTKNKITSKKFLGEWIANIRSKDEINTLDKFIKENEKHYEDGNIKEFKNTISALNLNLYVGYESFELKQKEVTFKDVSKKDLDDILNTLTLLAGKANDFKRVFNKIRAFLDLFMLKTNLIPANILIRIVLTRTGIVHKTAANISLISGNLFKITTGAINSGNALVKTAIRELK